MVNEGKNNYSGTTVYLDSDLSFSGKAFEPIGINKTYQFLGIFDGKGHIISNLQISASSPSTGLFGYSNGLTIRNVVLDSSCSISSSFTGDDYVRVGGFIGCCLTYNGKCSIENSVNMADVTFSGNIGYSLYIGGAIGYVYSSSSYGVHVENCVNYGSVTDSGTVSDYAELGGIVGYSQGSSSTSNHYIQNCLSYGTITHSGESSNLYIGGIVGNSYYLMYIENCVSAGKIFTQAPASGGNCIGSIIGQADSNTYIYYCYHTSDVNVNSINGAGAPSSTTGTQNYPTTVNPELVSNLNANATSCNWNKWLLNANNATVTFKMNDNKEISFSSQIILIPKPVKEGNSFLFWCKDSECNEEFNPETESVSGITDLYAAWVNNIVTFDFDNGTSVNETFSYNTEIIYPDMKKEGYTFNRWDNYHELMPARDITVTAQWTPNNYTVIFDFDNGTLVNVTSSYNTEIIYPDVKKEGYTLSWSNYHEFIPAKNITVTAQWTPNNYTVTFDANGGDISESSKVVTFNEKYGNLPEPNRTGYMFIGWFTNETNGTEVTNETIVTTPGSHTLYAHWDAKNYTVTFDATDGSVSETSKNVTFDEKYGKLPEPKKEGYMFIGWFTNETNGTEVTNETIVTTPDNNTLYARWEEVTNQVEIVFSTKDLTQDEVKKFIEQYVNADFEIAGFEIESGEIKPSSNLLAMRMQRSLSGMLKNRMKRQALLKRLVLTKVITIPFQ